jgi:hypothetical protein
MAISTWREQKRRPRAYRQLMTVEEARKKWRELVEQVGYKRVA